MTHEEIARYLGVSVPTVERRWRIARAWLYRELESRT
jgi:DNA-directed RNA polymerase specialized sigma24 family protein